MSYKALYRKYRPETLNQVVGQEHIVKTLTNQINNNKVAHAYLFTGSRGTGKTSIAKIFARSVNCESPIEGSACMTCKTCKSVMDGSALNVIEIDAASNNGVDNIRDINAEVVYTPAIGKYKVYIIDEVHMLSTGAFNALLKTLEEPPTHVIFVLATTDPQKVPATILSRCQRFDFRRLTITEISQALKGYMKLENVSIEDEAIAYIARLSDGGMRDALSILEQCISFFSNETITLEKVLKLLGAVDNSVMFDVTDAIIKGDSTKVIEICDEVNLQGRNLRQFVNDLVTHIRNLIVAASTKNNVGILDYSQEHIARLKNQSQNLGMKTAMELMKALSSLEAELKTSTSPKVSLEVNLINLCDIKVPELQEKENPTSIVKRVIELETNMAKVLSGTATIVTNTVPVVTNTMPVENENSHIEQNVPAQTKESTVKSLFGNLAKKVEEKFVPSKKEEATQETLISSHFSEVEEEEVTTNENDETIESLMAAEMMQEVEQETEKESSPSDEEISIANLIAAELATSTKVEEVTAPTEEVSIENLIAAEMSAVSETVKEQETSSVEDDSIENLIAAEMMANTATESTPVAVEEDDSIANLIAAEMMANSIIEQKQEEDKIKPLNGDIGEMIKEVIIPEEKAELVTYAEYVSIREKLEKVISISAKMVLNTTVIEKTTEGNTCILFKPKFNQVISCVKSEIEEAISNLLDTPKIIETQERVIA